MSDRINTIENGNNNKHHSRLSNIFHMVGAIVNWFEVSLLSIGVFLLAAILIANVIARNFFRSIYYAEEVSMILVLFITFVGVSYAVRKARHIRMGAIFDMLNPKIKKILLFIIVTYSSIVMFLMAYYTYQYMITSMVTMQVTPSLRIPYWMTLIIVVIGFASAGIQFLRTIIKNIIEKDVWLSPEQQSEYEEVG
ncbi:MAG: TRAP transporter small permease [Bacillota bacterium]|nr:TRAP transporter small permease [Bacillota bacterium]